MAKQYWYVTITDPATGEAKYLTAPTQYELNAKVEKQQISWKKRAERIERMNSIEELKEEAESRDRECKEKIEILRNLLKSKVEILNIDKFYAEKPADYNYPKFKCSQEEPNIEGIFKELKVPKENKFFEMLSKKTLVKRVDKEKEANELFESRVNSYSEKIKQEQEHYDSQKAKFEELRLAYNVAIIKQKQQFFKLDQKQVEKYVLEALKSSEYFKDFSEVLSQIETQYKPESKILVVSRMLPTPDLLPEYAGFKYVSTKKTIEGINWKQKEKDKFYEDTIFQITLKTINDLFYSIDKSVLNMIAFNGWVTYVDTSKGKLTTSCIISLEVDRDDLNDINFLLVEDFKKCVKGFKGIFNPNIKELIPVTPVLDIDRKDKRFINDIDVSDILYDEFNLATMEWEDFEYLVRQLFEKIFSYKNSEVKITQASRDGGVDAVAFDPDPIRGGKFVIQAKRYNILVPVSAVRDLFGTIMHEGASRGILVTTSHFGKDAYNFSKDKPITLINGDELLGLLHDNGFKNTIIKLNR